jgi:hypothetical protein
VSAPTPSTLGDTAIEASVDNNVDGQAEAFPATAQTGGSLTALNVFLDALNGARTVVVGLYSSNSGHPGTLLTQGTITAPVAAAWNSVAVPPVTINSGSTYWIAIMGLNGGIQFRDRASGPCSSETSQQTTLSALPVGWTSGASWSACPASAYGTLSGNPTPSISVTISPSSASLQSGHTAQFTAMINGSPSNAVSWTAAGGTITPSGLYTAGASQGTFSVTATSTADNTKSASASVVVTVPPPSVSISIAPASATLTPGGTQLFTATVAGNTNTNVKWTATGGTISASGLYTAGSAPGTFSVTATSAADQAKSASASVTVAVPGTSTLAQTAASMQPGSWAPLATNSFGAGNILRPPDGGSGLEFNERAVWNPVNSMAMILGGSHPGASTTCNSTFLAGYTESTNTWTNNLPSPCPSFDDSTGVVSTNLGHPYDHQAIDSNGNLYHRQYASGKVMVFSQATQAWSQCSPFNTSGFTTNSWGNLGEFQVAASLVYFPDRNSIILLDGDWGLWELPLASGCNGKWTLLASTNGGGFSPQLTGLGSYHNIGQYSVSCQCVIIGGNSNQMYKIDVNNNITKLALSPVFLGIPQNPGTPVGTIYTVDPVSGHFLVWSGNNSDNGTAYDYNPLTDTWATTGIKSPIFPGPEGGVTETVAIPIAKYGVIMFVQSGSAAGGAVYLYKHTSSSSGTPAVSVIVTPTTASIQTSGTTQFTATVMGTSNTAVTWTTNGGGGTISSSGLYAAPANAGTWTVTATSVADSTKSATATVTVTAPVPTVSVSISPTTATVATGGVQAFTATVTGTSNMAVNWTTTGGTISPVGVLTAPATTGTITVTATSAADSTKSASATVNVALVSPGTINGWTSRTSGTNIPGGQASVVGTQSFDSFPVTTQQQYFQLYDPASITTDCAIAADGCSLKFSVLKGYQQGEPGWLNWNFSPDLSKTFGNGQEFYVQYRYRVDPGMLNGANFPNSEGFKAHILTEGDTARVQAGDCGNSPGELVLQQDGVGSAFPIMYHNCGFSGGQFNFMQSGYQLITLPGIIGTNFLDQNIAGCPHYDGRGIPTTDPACFNYVANEWMTVQVHVRVGSFNNPNSTIELWLGHQGQPAELVVNASDAALVNDGSGGASGRYGKIALLPYQTNMSGSLVDTAVWYDDLMVSTRRIPDPDIATPNAPDSLTVSANGSSAVLAWRVNSANGTPQDDTGFLVERCAGDGTVCFPNPQSGFALIGLTAPGASSYADSTAIPGATYTYRVRARNPAGNSAFAASQCFNATGITCGGTISIP